MRHLRRIRIGLLIGRLALVSVARGGAPIFDHGDNAQACTWAVFWRHAGMGDFVTIDAMSRLYYRATVLDARDGVEVTIWHKCPGGAVSLTRRELLPDGAFETVVKRLTTANRWL